MLNQRMFRGKFRSNTCRIILVTSLVRIEATELTEGDGGWYNGGAISLFQVWMLIDVLLILHYADVGQTWNGSDGGGQNARRRGSYDIEVSRQYICVNFYFPFAYLHILFVGLT